MGCGAALPVLRAVAVCCGTGVVPVGAYQMKGITQAACDGHL